MKLLSVAIPCYNSEAYMANCIESLLVGGEEVEIIVVNDGSKDKSLNPTCSSIILSIVSSIVISFVTIPLGKIQ